jgi:hypothetical protein
MLAASLTLLCLAAPPSDAPAAPPAAPVFAPAPAVEHRAQLLDLIGASQEDSSRAGQLSLLAHGLELLVLGSLGVAVLGSAVPDYLKVLLGSLLVIGAGNDLYWIGRDANYLSHIRPPEEVAASCKIAPDWETWTSRLGEVAKRSRGARQRLAWVSFALALLDDGLTVLLMTRPESWRFNRTALAVSLSGVTAHAILSLYRALDARFRPTRVEAVISGL